jgi:hypothetical protein
MCECYFCGNTTVQGIEDKLEICIQCRLEMGIIRE